MSVVPFAIPLLSILIAFCCCVLYVALFPEDTCNQHAKPTPDKLGNRDVYFYSKYIPGLWSPIQINFLAYRVGWFHIYPVQIGLQPNLVSTELQLQCALFETCHQVKKNIGFLFQVHVLYWHVGMSCTHSHDDLIHTQTVGGKCEDHTMRSD